jgi:hypothetical protein
VSVLICLAWRLEHIYILCSSVSGVAGLLIRLSRSLSLSLCMCLCESERNREGKGEKVG